MKHFARLIMFAWKSLSVVPILLFFLSLNVMRADAAVTVTAASGGTNISADYAANSVNPSGGQYTLLGDITISEQNNSDFSSGTNVTLTLQAPSGWLFNTSNTLTLSGSFQNNSGQRNIDAASITGRTSSTITITLTVNGTNKSDNLTISGIEVKASSGAAIPSSGNIFRPTTGGGTAAINGITTSGNVNGTGGTNFGSLSQKGGLPVSLSFPNSISTQTAGTSFNIVVTGSDQFGNGANGTLNLSTTAGTISPTSAALSIGTVTTPVIVSQAGTGKTITASLNSASATSNSFTVNPGAAFKVVFGTQPSNTVAGAFIAPVVTLQVQDANSNVVTSSSANIAVAIGNNAGGGTLSGTLAVNASSGVATFSNLSINKTGTGYTLAASSGSLTGATSSPFNITPGTVSASQSTIAASPTTVTADGTSSSTITVTAKDANGNLIPGITPANVVLSSTGTNNTLTQPSAATNASGQTSGTIKSTKAETKTLSVTINGTTITATTSVSFVPGAVSAAQSTIAASPATVTADGTSASTITVTAKDANGNLIPGITPANVVLSSTGTNNTLTQPSAVTDANGQTSGTLKSTKAETKTVSVTINGTAITATTSVTFAAGAASKIVFGAQPSNTVAGASISPAITVQVQDANSNVVTTSSASVTLAIGNNAGGGTLSGTTTVNASSGVATFSNLSINKTGTGYTLAATSGSLTGATSSTFNITPGAASKIVFASQPSNTVAGASITPAVTVQVQDANSNVVTTSSASVTLAIGNNAGGGTLSGTTTVNASSGVATFSNVSINKTGTGYTLAASSGTLTGATSSAFNINPTYTNYRTKVAGTFSDFNVWEVNTSGSTYVPATSPTEIPGTNDNVEITSAITLDQDFTVGANREFTISTGTLTVAPGKSLTIAGTGNFNGQPVTFRSDATGTAMLGIVSGSLTGATNVTIERYLPARRTWRILTAPLTNTGSVFANWQNNGSATGTTGAEIWAPGATSGSGLTAAGNAPSMQYFDYLSNKWVNVTDTKGTSLSGTTNQGFSIFVTGPFGSPNYITSGSAPTTLVAHGALQVGNHQALYANPAGHYILVPNPYAAPVDFAKVTRSSNIPDGFWAWDPTLGGTGSYATVSKDGSAYDIAPASSAQTQVIQNGQAVFVKSTDNTAASLTFHEADKDISKASGQVFRQAGTASKLYINLNKLVNNTPKIADGVLAKFGEGYKAEAGSDDAAKLFGNEENIAIRRSGAYLSIERRPDVVKYDTLFLNIFKMKAGPYSLEVKPDNFDITGLKATIRDKFLNTQTTVDLINGTTLTFMVTTDAASYAADRFIVVFEQQKVLAVTFTGLKAFELNGNVQVEWQMAEAPDADYYEVERSLDGRSFTVAAQLAAKHSGATESYAWLDKQAQAGTNYYRITMYTKEAAVLKSSIVQVVLAKGAPAIAAFPNPVVNRLVQLQLRNMQTGSYVISIYNTAGIQVAAKKVTLTTPNATQTLTLPKGTAAGNYQAVIKDAQGHQWYQPIAVQ